MKKVLIYRREGELTKSGGPIGYNYALKLQLDKMNVGNIEFLPGGKVYNPGLGKKLKKKKIKTFLKTIKDIFRYSKSMFYSGFKPIVELNKYDIVHFQTCMSMYELRKSLRNYKGKVVLTSHSPQVSYLEIIDSLTTWEQKHMRWFYNKMIRFDQYAFRRADYVIFPCPEAEEPYYHTWEEFAAIKKDKRDSFRYLLTGTYKCHETLPKSGVRELYGIPQDAFVVCYVGRHNSVKGYDSLKQIGEEVLKLYDNVYFLVAGEEYPIKRLEHSNWIEVGWTNDPHSLIAASDVFVLPNRETYFDLIMLEVLSLGKIVVASYTGGNKYFTRIGAKGVRTYRSIDEAVQLIYEVKCLTENERTIAEESNLYLYDKNFSLEVFGTNYIELMNKLE